MSRAQDAIAVANAAVDFLSEADAAIKEAHTFRRELSNNRIAQVVKDLEESAAPKVYCYFTRDCGCGYNKVKRIDLPLRDSYTIGLNVFADKNNLDALKYMLEIYSLDHKVFIGEDEYFYVGQAIKAISCLKPGQCLTEQLDIKTFDIEPEVED